MNKKTFAVCTLGCKVNAYESDCLAALFEKEGLIRRKFDEKADIYLINTCSVTNTGDKKSRQAIHKARRLNPDAFIAVCGCFAQASPKEAERAGADLICGTKNRGEIIARALNSEGGSIVTDASESREFEELAAPPSTDRCRAYIKIQDGCNNFCSYCIIPYTRGRVRSRDEISILREAKRLTEEGFSEIVLAGIEVYSYGTDTKETDLISLLERISSLAAPRRIRLSSIDPRAFTDEFIARLASLKGLCRHFHISAQSGCDETLKRMNRRYTVEEFLAIIEKIRSAMPNAAVTTDIITGFPGETEEEFSETVEFVKKARFSRLHVFPYSERSGTRAADMEQLPVKTRSIRAKALIEEGKRLSFEFAKGLEGMRAEVLIEHEKNGLSYGYTENYVRCLLPERLTVGRIYPVILKKARPDGSITGEIYKED